MDAEKPLSLTALESRRKAEFARIEAEHNSAAAGLRRKRQEDLLAADERYREGWRAIGDYAPHEPSVDRLHKVAHAERRHCEMWAIVYNDGVCCLDRLFDTADKARAYLKSEYPYRHGSDGFHIVKVAVVPLYDGIRDFLRGGLA